MTQQQVYRVRVRRYRFSKRAIERQAAGGSAAPSEGGRLILDLLIGVGILVFVTALLYLSPLCDALVRACHCAAP